jgi:lipoate-protein ligase A
MYVLRGRAPTLEADRERTGATVERAVETDTPTLRVWPPHRQVAFGRRDARTDGYDHARAIAKERGYPPIERQVGGRAVAYTGSTVAFTYADPGTERTAIESRYEDATSRLQSALGVLGVDASEGEPDGAFCPGTHSLQSGGKVAGLAQRVRRDVAVVGGIVVVRDEEAIADVLDPIYDALGVPFEPDAVGSVRRAGGPDEPETVCRAVVDAFTDGDVRTEYVRET